MVFDSGGAGYGSGAAGDIYNAHVGFYWIFYVTGKNATAKLTVNGSGTITAVKLMDGGSAYGIGNTHGCCWCRNYYWIMFKQFV